MGKKAPETRPPLRIDLLPLATGRPEISILTWRRRQEASELTFRVS